VYTSLVLFYITVLRVVGWDSSVVIANHYGLNGPGIESRLGDEIFCNRPDRPWDPPNFPYSMYRVSFPGGKSGRGVALTTYPI
jgi:hypothetical protein